MLPPLDISGKISKFTGFSEDEIIQLINMFHKKYKRYQINKKSGQGTREILHPAKELKAIQYAIHETTLRQPRIHGIATAYIRGSKSPLYRTALAHCDKKYTVRIDFNDFFPSIRPVDLVHRLKLSNSVSELDNIIIKKALYFYKKSLDQYILPIGAPTSPTISNIVMYDLDEEIAKLAKATDNDSSVTRYADDLHFSTNHKGKCRVFFEQTKKLLLMTQTPSLSINESKTLYLSRGTRRVVTGLFVTPDAQITIGQERKKEIKKLIYNHSKGTLTQEEIKYIKGLLSFVRDCEPSFLDKLAIKYDQTYYSIMAL